MISHYHVSVVIPAFNAASHIERAIDSVFDQETKLSYEVIVVDDGSTDSTRIVCNSYVERINYIFQENQGVSAARNRGVSEAKSDFILFLDSDDVLEPCAIDALTPPFLSSESIGGCSGIVLMQGSADKDFFRPPSDKFPEGKIDLYERSIIDPISTASGVAVRKHFFETIRGFTLGLHFGEDIELWNRIYGSQDWYFVPKCVAKYIRSPETSVTCRVPFFMHGFDFIWSENEMASLVRPDRYSSYRKYKTSVLLGATRLSFVSGIKEYGDTALRLLDSPPLTLKLIIWKVIYRCPPRVWCVLRAIFCFIKGYKNCSKATQ